MHKKNSIRLLILALFSLFLHIYQNTKTYKNPENIMSGYDKEFSDCYTKFAKPLTRFVNKNIHNWDISEEIVQDIFTYLYARKEPLDADNRSLVAFIFRIARHRIIDYIKKNKNRITSCTSVDSAPDLSKISKIESNFIEKEMHHNVSKIIYNTNNPQREIIVRSYEQGHKIKRISRDMSISEYKISKVLKNFSMTVRDTIGPLYQ
jgi:RNA polymerase sigma factor (sigma-70 family)